MTHFKVGEATKFTAFLEYADGFDKATLHRVLSDEVDDPEHKSACLSDDDWQHTVNLIHAAPKLLSSLREYVERDHGNHAGLPEYESAVAAIRIAEPKWAHRALLCAAGPEGRTARAGGAELACLRFDNSRDAESWSWHAVFSVTGNLPSDPDGWDVNEILRAIEACGVRIRPEGGNCAGGPFAGYPWVQFLGRPVRTLWVSQSGGLDV